MSAATEGPEQEREALVAATLRFMRARGYRVTMPTAPEQEAISDNLADHIRDARLVECEHYLPTVDREPCCSPCLRDRILPHLTRSPEPLTGDEREAEVARRVRDALVNYEVQDPGAEACHEIARALLSLTRSPAEVKDADGLDGLLVGNALCVAADERARIYEGAVGGDAAFLAEADAAYLAKVREIVRTHGTSPAEVEREVRERIERALMDAAPGVGFGMSHDGTEDPQASAYAEGWRDAIATARSIGGETGERR